MKHTKLLLAIVLALLCVLFVSYRIYDANRNDANSIKIGSVLALTGPAGALGEELKRGQEIAIDFCQNQNIPVKVIWGDSKSTPAEAISIFRSMQAQGVELYIANLSNVCLSLKSSIDGNNSMLLAIASHPGISTPPQNGVVLYSQTAEDEAKTIAESISQNFPGKDVILIHSDDEYGRGFVSQFEKEAESYKIKLTKAPVLSQNQSLRDAIQAYMTNNSAIPVIVGVGKPMAMAFNHIRELGYRDAVYFNIGYSVTGVESMLGEDKGKIFYTKLELIQTPDVVYVQNKYRELFNKDATPEAIFGFNAVMFYVKSAAKAHSTKEIASIIVNEGREYTCNPAAGKENEIVIGVKIHEN